METIWKLAGLGVTISIIGLVLDKSGKTEYSYLVGLVGLLIGAGIVAKMIAELFSDIGSLFRL